MNRRANTSHISFVILIFYFVIFSSIEVYVISSVMWAILIYIYTNIDKIKTHLSNFSTKNLVFLVDICRRRNISPISVINQFVYSRSNNVALLFNYRLQYCSSLDNKQFFFTDTLVTHILLVILAVRILCMLLLGR